MTTSYRCWAEINLEAIRSNLRALRSMVASEVRVAAIIKADAYGHGLPEVARGLDRDADLFGVACLVEARAIRSTGSQTPILILGSALPEERVCIADEGFIPSVSTINEAAAYARCARAGQRVSIHLVIDTGMGRIGVSEEEAGEAIRAIREMAPLRLAAVSSHLPVADEDEEYTVQQLDRFRALVKSAFPGDEPVAILNSAGVIRFGKVTRPGDIVRAGLALYGISPVPEFQPHLRPAMTLKTRVALVRWLGPGRSISYGRTFVTPGRMKVATLCAGYGDGVDRHLSGQGSDVLLHGQRCRLLGRVTMDQIMVDVSHLEHVEPGDEAVLVGRQGDLEILASELAARAGTIAWEIFTGITKRVVRIYY